MHYYRFHIGDYVSHTRHLVLLGDLAYRKILDLYYLHEHPLSGDASTVAKQILMLDHVEIVSEVLNEFFERTDEGYLNRRAEEEISSYHSQQDRSSKAGKASAKSRSKGRSTEALTDVQPTKNHEPLTKNHELSLTASVDAVCPSNEELTTKPKIKLPNCDHKGIIDSYHKHLPTLRRMEVWNQTRTGHLKARWREVAIDMAAINPAVTSQELIDWWTELFKDIGKSKFLMGKTIDKDGRSFAADLEWIIKPNNFAKIIEGKYYGNN